MKLRPCAIGPSLSMIEAKALARNFVDERALPEKTTSIALGVPGPISRWRTDFIFDYAIFPSSILRFDAEWRTEERKMAVGDVIVQRAVIPPVGFGLCLEFAVRVSAMFVDRSRIGFAYETLTGHAESGVSEFFFEERDDGLVFTIHTFSQPGHWTSRVAKEIFTLPYQAWCTSRALRNVKRRFQLENQTVANQSTDPTP
jgi:uncharacterized protein (UPF0548 family)